LSTAYRWIHRVWYEGAASGWLLLPLSVLYGLLLKLRGLLFDVGIFRSYKAEAPVIVVGNITAGGTGKTPTVIWLVQALRAKGFTPGIVSRGYGGSHSGAAMRVDAHSDTSLVGDEPVLLAKRGQCPVVVDADRVRATAMLIEDGVNLIIADDGLQHRRLQRDYEICVVDGERGLGNRRLLPAGPLREPASRLETVDQVLVNGTNALANAMAFELRAMDACRLNGSLARPLEGFKDMTVHAVAGIGNPKRFFDLLRSHGIQVIEHEFPDHAEISLSELDFDDTFDVFMTEKDAVKLDGHLSDKYWHVPVDFYMDTEQSKLLIEHVVLRLQSVGDQR